MTNIQHITTGNVRTFRHSNHQKMKVVFSLILKNRIYFVKVSCNLCLKLHLLLHSTATGIKLSPLSSTIVYRNLQPVINTCNLFVQKHPKFRIKVNFTAWRTARGHSTSYPGLFHYVSEISLGTRLANLFQAAQSNSSDMISSGRCRLNLPTRILFFLTHSFQNSR